MTAIVMPAQNGIKPGPGSLQLPMSILRAYSAKKAPIIRKKIPAMRSY